MGTKKPASKICVIKRVYPSEHSIRFTPQRRIYFRKPSSSYKRNSQKVLDINRRRQTKEGFAQSIKELFREYDSKPFLYNVNTPDFQSFVTKLPKDTLQKIKFDSFEAFRQAAQAANLTLKMEPSQAYGILSALLTTVNAKETLSATCDYFAVFDCMTDILVNSIFE